METQKEISSEELMAHRYIRCVQLACELFSLLVNVPEEEAKVFLEYAKDRMKAHSQPKE